MALEQMNTEMIVPKHCRRAHGHRVTNTMSSLAKKYVFAAGLACIDSHKLFLLINLTYHVLHIGLHECDITDSLILKFLFYLINYKLHYCIQYAKYLETWLPLGDMVTPATEVISGQWFMRIS